LLIDATDMAGLAARADIAVGAGGSSAWERCIVGLPSLAVVLADNQRANTLALAEAGACLALEAAEGLAPPLAEAFTALCDDGVRRARMSEAAAGLCDGLGADRVAARMLRTLSR
jgi:spore coat polysaccharide biosynthesis predicted glycosyltransferase SpsG